MSKIQPVGGNSTASSSDTDFTEVDAVYYNDEKTIYTGDTGTYVYSPSKEDYIHLADASLRMYLNGVTVFYSGSNVDYTILRSPTGSHRFALDEGEGIRASTDGGETYYAVNTDNPTQPRAGYINGVGDDGYIGQVIELNQVQDMATSLNISVTLTAGCWLVTGNVYIDTSDTSVGGYLKGALSQAEGGFSKYKMSQVDKGTLEADSGFPVKSQYFGLTEEDIIYLNFEAENGGSLGGSVYMSIQAIRIA